MMPIFSDLRSRRLRSIRATGLAAGLVAALALLTGCDVFFGSPEAPPLPGERISVLKMSSALAIDPSLAQQQVVLPKPETNPDWPQPGGYSTHAMYHLALGDNIKTAWTARIGRSAGDGRAILAEPVSVGGRVFTMDAGATVTAFDLTNGGQVWRVDLTPEDENDDLFGGGLASDGKMLYVTTGYEHVYALDASSGAIGSPKDTDGSNAVARPTEEPLTDTADCAPPAAIA